MTLDSSKEPPAACFSCHLIGIASSTAIGGYMFYQAKQAKTSSHRFACSLVGLTFIILGSHRISSLFKDISQRRIWNNDARLKHRFESKMLVDNEQLYGFRNEEVTRPVDANSSIDINSKSIFKRTEFPWRFDRNTTINNLVVSNKVFIFHINEKVIQRRNIDESSKSPKDLDSHQDIQMPDSIRKIFLDPTGQVVLVSTREKRDVYVLISSSNSLKLCKKPLKLPNNTSFVLASVSWCNRFLKQTNDIVALLAGQDGTIYEISIRTDGDCSYCNEVYSSFRSVLNSKTDSVSGIYCDVKSTQRDNGNLFLVITTQRYLFYYERQIDVSKKSDYFTSFFSVYQNKSLVELKYQELPSSQSNSEILVCTKMKPLSANVLERQFAWITGVGLFYTEIDPNNVEDSFLKGFKVINYYFDKAVTQKDEEKPPKSVALTEFHSLLMFPNENQIRIVCTVNNKMALSDPSIESGTHVCFAYDPFWAQLWACTDLQVFRYTVNDERRNVWRIFVEQKEFQRALDTCLVANDAAETIRRARAIFSKKADFLFEQQKFLLSARDYAQSDTQFEDATLKFFSLKDKEPLREYLQAVLANLKSSTDSSQITILTLWLTDLYLNELNELRSTSSGSTATSPSNQKISDKISKESPIDENNPKKIEAIRLKFKNFLARPEIQRCLKEHESAMYELLTSHGNLDDLILFAEHVEDHERVISIHLEREQYNKALATLERLSNLDLLYKYSPNLIEKLPRELIELWKKKYNSFFDAKQLLPAMITYSQSNPNGKEVLDFLKFCLRQGCVDSAIHNYLLSEYAKFDRKEIMKYLIDQKEDLSTISYDPRYALSLCIDNKLTKESVFLFRLLNMYEEAVETALQFDVAEAKSCASLAPNNNERTKKLWLKIAESVIKEGKDLNQVMSILNDCDSDLLKIEDILPLFPNFETIDQFKQPIISSLERYNNRLNDLKSEMKDASKSIDEIREDLAKYRTRCIGTIDSNASCSLCDQVLMLQPIFYVFPCEHYFHSDCLSSYVQQIVKINGNETTTSKNSMMTKTIDTINRLQSIIASGVAPPSRDMDSVQQELDDLLASHCVLCGEIAVDHVDHPLEGRL